MVGLIRPDSGEVRYHGISYTELKNPARLVGSVLDARCMHPGRTARNQLRATAALSGVPARRAEEVLAEVGLDTAENQRAGGFSLGMRQRLALPERSSVTLRSFCSTSHPTAWTLTASAGCAPTSATSPTGAARSSCRATSSAVAFDSGIRLVELTGPRWRRSAERAGSRGVGL
jgi:hypothetical protein